MCSNSQVHLHMRAAKHTLVHTIAHRHDFPLACEPAIRASRETTDSQGKVLMVSNICQECSKAGTVGYVYALEIPTLGQLYKSDA